MRARPRRTPADEIEGEERAARELSGARDPIGLTIGLYPIVTLEKQLLNMI